MGYPEACWETSKGREFYFLYDPQTRENLGEVQVAGELLLCFLLLTKASGIRPDVQYRK